MLSFRRTTWIILIAVYFCTIVTPPAKAMDPVTIAILAPIAIKAAKVMRPYIQKGLISGTRGLIQTGKDTLEILYLPWGIVQMTLGLPFGGLGPGMANVGRGLIAPFKVVADVLYLPIQFTGFVN
jgi:hypothetical protein